MLLLLARPAVRTQGNEVYALRGKDVGVGSNERLRAAVRRRAQANGPARCG